MAIQYPDVGTSTRNPLEPLRAEEVSRAVGDHHATGHAAVTAPKGVPVMRDRATDAGPTPGGRA